MRLHSDDELLARIRGLQGHKLLKVEDLIAAFSSPGRPFSAKSARTCIRRAQGFQLGERGEWRCTRNAFRETYPKLYELLCEHEAEQL